MASIIMARAPLPLNGFVRAVGYTAGNEHGSQSLEKLQTGAEEQVYADLCPRVYGY